MHTPRGGRATVALATCSAVPGLDEDESLVIPALAARGVVAEAAVWDSPAVDWSAYELVVVRSTWDYADRRDRFLAWSGSLTHVLNGRRVLEWNTDKVYLREVAARGIPVVPTTWLDPAGGGDAAWPADAEIVVKPAVSSGARNTSRYRAGDAGAARAHVDRLLAEARTVMVQPYVRSVDDAGETALIYLGDAFSHCVHKGPLLRQPGRITSGLWEPETITATTPSSAERELAENVLDALPWPRRDLLYARVDMVAGADGAPLVLEVELTEPSLFLARGDGAPKRFARAIASSLGAR